MPERCSRLMIARSRQIAWMELKQPFHRATQVRAKALIRQPSILAKILFRITMETSPAITAAMGITFQSLSLIKNRNCLPRKIGT